MTNDIRIQRLELKHIAQAEAHLTRHILESGQHGVHFVPYTPESKASNMSIEPKSLTLATDEIGWERWFGVFDADVIVGHLNLQGAKFDLGLHRCELGIGLEHPYRSMGLGTKLMHQAIDEAKALPGIDYLDLRVLHINTAAIRLYTQMGFHEVYRIPDFCRIDGEIVDDVFMTIQVG